MTRRTQRVSGAFTLVEVLVVCAIIALLVGTLLPSLSGARDAGRAAACASNQRQMLIAWTGYALDACDRAMPLAYWTEEDISRVQGATQTVYWWGTLGQDGTVDHSRGMLMPYLAAALHAKSVLECPAQAWGTYRPQGPARQPTSTYGYNGYFLSPAHTPGWGQSIGFRPWQRVSSLARPSELAVFADTMIVLGGVRNCALLDPPMIYSGSGAWVSNPSPTTAFRHGKRNATMKAAIASADGSVRNHGPSAQNTSIVNSGLGIGSIMHDNEPWYVPDWREWR